MYSPLAVGGIGQFIHDFGIALRGRGHDVTAVFRYEIPEFSADEGFNESVRQVEIRPWQIGGFRTLSLNLKTVSWLGEHRNEFDIVHVLNPMPVCAAAMRAAHRYRIPVVATIYAKYPRSPKILLRFVNDRAQEQILREADSLVYEAPSTQEDFSLFPGRVILNGVDTQLYKPNLARRASVRKSLGIALDDFVVLYLGRLDKLKGIYTLLDALQILRTGAETVTTLLVGSVEIRDLENEIGRRGLRSFAKVVGPVGKNDVVDYYCSADVFVLPSFLEGISSALIEAMACGTPVVATNVGGNTSVVRHEQDGLLVPPGNPHSLAKALLAIMNDVGLRRSLGTSARARIQDRFSLETMTNEYEAVYREVSSRRLSKR